MEIESHRGQERDANEGSRRRPLFGASEEECQRGATQDRVRARFGGVEKEKGGESQKHEEEGPRPAGESASGEREGKRREPGKSPDDRVPNRSGVGERHERLLHQIEKRRAGVRRERLDERRGRETRGPDSEDLVVPQRTRVRETEAERGGGGQDGEGERFEAGEAWRTLANALS
jgi:hypothetical protein